MMEKRRRNTEVEKDLKQACIGDMTAKINQYLLMCDDVLFAFLFGSSVGDRIKVFNDVDIAIYFNGKIDFYRINNLRENLTELLGTDADIVVLNTASPIIRMQVLKKGTLLAQKDQRAYHDFFVNTVKEYDDLKRNRKDIEDKILRGRIYA
ncbi:MAG: nucleotidyltransferase domain-containing protein [Nitrospira sp.]|nr:nucleotidyltransferase domain-containing protein [Nitrospira sp.]